MQPSSQHHFVRQRSLHRPVYNDSKFRHILNESVRPVSQVIDASDETWQHRVHRSYSAISLLASKMSRCRVTRTSPSPPSPKNVVCFWAAFSISVLPTKYLKDCFSKIQLVGSHISVCRTRAGSRAKTAYARAHSCKFGN